MVILFDGYIAIGAKNIELRAIQHRNNKTIEPSNNCPQLELFSNRMMVVNKIPEIMKDRFDKMELTPKERFIEFAGNAVAIIMLIAFFLKIVIF